MKLDLPVIPPADIQQGWDGQFGCGGIRVCGIKETDDETCFGTVRNTSERPGNGLLGHRRPLLGRGDAPRMGGGG